MNTMHSTSRRDFLKKTLAGAALLRTSGARGLVAAEEKETMRTKSRVVIAHDAQLRGTGPASGSNVDSRRILALLDRAVQALFDRDRPLERSEEHTSELQSLRHLV